MSDMSFLDKLLDGAEVEWKSLGEVSLKSYSGGTPKVGNAKYYEGGTIPWLRTQEVVFSDIHETAVKITQAAIDETAAKWIPENCVIVAISGATAGRSGINKIPLTTNQHCCCLKIDPEQALYRYVFYWVSMNYEKLKDLGQGARGDLNSGIIKGFPIPIPCPDNPEKSLAIQAEIVRILDAFTELTTELTTKLTTELTARKKQYNYYRDQLLTFSEDEVEWKPLGEVCDFKNGFAFKSSLFRESGLPIVRITNVDGANVNLGDVKYFDPADYTSGNPLNYPIVKGDILIAMSGATTGKIGYYSYEETAYLNQRVGKFVPDTEVLNNRFLYHFLLSKAEFLYVLAGGGAQPNLSSTKLKEKMLIPLPSPEEQKRIASILDNFYAIATSITEGLPREIELRQKQYAYYRDLLFSFPKKEVEAKDE